MKKGWVYVSSMSKRPGMLKIGQSERDPEGRVDELSNRNSGEVQIECAVLVEDPSTHKEMIWQKLVEKGVKPFHDSQEQNQFASQGIFKCQLVDIVNVILDLGDIWVWTKGVEEYLVEFTVRRESPDYPEFSNPKYELEFEVSALSSKHAIQRVTLEVDRTELEKQAESRDMFRDTNAELAARMSQILALFYSVNDEVTVYSRHGHETLRVSEADSKIEIIGHDETKVRISNEWEPDIGYIGGWKDGKRSGHGVQSYGSGQHAYEGEWKDDVWHGRGKWVRGPDSYVGEYRNGKKNGKGTETAGLLACEYVGDWRDDKKHGQGIEKNSRLGPTVVTVGEWKNDKCWNATRFDKNGNKDGAWIEGEFKPLGQKPKTPEEEPKKRRWWQL